MYWAQCGYCAVAVVVVVVVVTVSENFLIEILKKKFFSLKIVKIHIYPRIMGKRRTSFR